MTRKDEPPSLIVPVDAQPAPARRGRLGLCEACHDPVQSHFDTQGQFIGCPAADPETVFVLWPYNGAAINPAAVGRAIPRQDPPPETRHGRKRLIKARYHATPALLAASIDSLDLTPNRKEALKVFLACNAKTDDGVLYEDMKPVAQRRGVEHGVLQEALADFRKHGLLTATEAWTPKGKRRRRR